MRLADASLFFMDGMDGGFNIKKMCSGGNKERRGNESPSKCPKKEAKGVNGKIEAI